MAQENTQGQSLITRSVANPGHIGSGVKRSSASGCRTGGPVPLNTVHSTAGEQESTGFQPGNTEQTCQNRKVQTGKFGFSENHAETERLSDEIRLEGRILLGSNCRGTPEVPSISICGVTYEYQCLPFGLSSAPGAFTKLVKPVIAILRISGIRVGIYLDDLLLFHQDPVELQKIFQIVITLFTDLGFVIKLEKCSPSPTQAIIFLGAQLKSIDLTIAVPLEKLCLIQAECKEILARDGAPCWNSRPCWVG